MVSHLRSFGGHDVQLKFTNIYWLLRQHKNTKIYEIMFFDALFPVVIFVFHFQNLTCFKIDWFDWWVWKSDCSQSMMSVIGVEHFSRLQNLWKYIMWCYLVWNKFWNKIHSWSEFYSIVAVNFPNFVHLSIKSIKNLKVRHTLLQKI